MIKNGWQLAIEQLNGVPRWIPHALTVDLTVAASADMQTLSAASVGTAVVEQDATFYVFAGCLCGFDPATPEGNFGLGTDPDENPDSWPGRVWVSEELGGTYLSNRPVRASGVFGSGCRPHYWPCPWVLRPGTTVRLSVDQWYTTAQRCLFTFWGFKDIGSRGDFPLSWFYDPRLAMVGRRAVQPFFYGLDFIGTDRVPFDTETDTVLVAGGDFAALNLCGAVDDPDDGTPFYMADYGVSEYGESYWRANRTRRVSRNTCRLLSDVGAGRMDDRPFVLGNVFGSGRFPRRLPAPWIIRDGQSITALIKFNDTSGGDDLSPRCQLTIGGARLVG